MHWQRKTEESEKIEQETEIVQTENEEKKNLGTFVYISAELMFGDGQIQKQKLNTVTNITNGINKTLDKFIDINEQHLIFHFQ